VLRVLAARYGVLTREILNRERSDIAWRDAYPLLTRMEWAGELDRAQFLAELSGPQFAPREAADALARVSQSKASILLNVMDPANVFGDLFPILRPDGARHIIRHHPGNYLVLENGRPILAVENRGERLIPLCDISPQQRTACFRLLSHLVEGRERPSSILVQSWDGGSVIDSVAEKGLAAVGFVREDRGMVLYRRYT
jgi:hypothetical protein